MKKALLGLLILALVLPAVFADDALVMPAKVIRTYLTGAYATASKTYDADGKASDSDKADIINLGAAVEYGVNDWITGALQWAPGYNVYSKIKNQDKATLADAADLFVGAKLQVVGAKAPSQNETMRFAVAPGVKIPLSKPDWEKEFTNYISGDTYLGQAADHPVLGVGGRAYFDYVINEMFFLNLYSQYIYYPGKVALKESSLAGYYSYVLSGGAFNPDVQFGSDLTLEFEPHFSTMISDGLELSAGLPITYNTTSETKYDGTGQDDATNLLTVGPNASLFFQKTFLPLELKLGYSLPLMGKNGPALNTLSLQLKAYAKF